MQNFEFIADLLQEIPDDTVFIQIESLSHLMLISQRLVAAERVFIVNPKTAEIACSRGAAIAIGML